jgi:uncharacterized protein (DUF433 family)
MKDCGLRRGVIRMNVQQVVHSDPEIMSGTPVFVGTRVPVYNLFDYLEAGDPLEKFLASFPSVTRDQAVAALELAKEAVAELASAGR